MRAWEPEPGERFGVFEAFKVYRELGPHRRSLREAAALIYGDDKYRIGIKKVPGKIRNWSVRYDWVERSHAFEAWQEMIRKEAIEAYERESVRMSRHPYCATSWGAFCGW